MMSGKNGIHMPPLRGYKNITRNDRLLTYRSCGAINMTLLRRYYNGNTTDAINIAPLCG